MNDLLILVDEDDREIGYGEKMEVHKEARLHRAFSLFIFDKKNKKLLLQQRAEGKYHSGGLWTNSCCSHPRKGETLEEAVLRRTKEELGVDLSVYAGQFAYAGQFQYFKSFGDLAEHEIDHVFVLMITESLDIMGDPDEIGMSQWISLADLDSWLEISPDEFTAWFKPAYLLAKPFID